MDVHAEDSVVEGYESLIESLTLPDLDDRHVLAAAIHARADAIVTFNLKDFPGSVFAPRGIEAIHPDDFVTYQFDLNLPRVCAAAKRIRARLKNPPHSAEQYVERLRVLDCPEPPRNFASAWCSFEQ